MNRSNNNKSCILFAYSTMMITIFMAAAAALVVVVVVVSESISNVNAQEMTMTTVPSSLSSMAKTTTLLHMKLTDNDDDDDDHNQDRMIRRRLIIRRSQQQQQQPQSTPQQKLPITTTTTTTNLGRSIYGLREPFSFQQDNDSDDLTSSDQQQQQTFEITKKMDTMFELIETSFIKTMERIDNLERKMETMQTNFFELIKQSHKESINHGHHHQYESEPIINNSNNNNYPSILNKMYSIHQQTYQICKDALVLPKDNVPNCPTMTAVCSMIRQYRQDKHNNDGSDSTVTGSNNSGSSNSGNRRQDLVISAGNVHHKNYRDHVSDLLLDKRPIGRSHESDDDLDAEAMREVFGLFANWTLDQYVQRMHRNVAEELNVFNFQIKEKFQSLFEKFTKMDMLLKVSDQLSASMLDIRDQLYEDHLTLDKLSDRLQSLDQQQSNNNNDDKQLKCPATIVDDNHETMKNVTNLQIKNLLEEYFEKFLGHLNNSLPLTSVKTSSKRQTSTGVIKSKNESSTTVKFLIYDTANVQKATPASPSYKSISINDQTVTAPVFEPQTRSRLQKSKCSRDANVLYPSSCDELRRYGATCNGVYVILTFGSTMKHVYCDMGHNDGGWTVILRRGKFSSSKYLLNFDQNFNHYRAGFGDMHAGEFWIGLDYVHLVTSNEPHLLQIDLLDIEDNYVSMVYDGFLIGGRNDGYRFYVKGIRKDLLLSSNPNWNITELASIVLRHNRTQFVTADHINPIQSSLPTTMANKQQTFYRECATLFRSGWWYMAPSWSSSIYDNVPLIDSCRHLNQFQLMAPLNIHHEHLSVKWNNWHHDDDQHTTRQLRYIMMKIRPNNR
ncbi:hypothetical protein DERF_004424 [Dermatophagoides farinae]|uniref:Fibrinogen C-terminal domain-containing protein n=1 Tax=Dermatophagoides farinae TaxID=6954 RepID=A0A922I1F0_DERFA|nr:hypothetical protein DERF_004424 [Dermatophagoides farinae]